MSDIKGSDGDVGAGRIGDKLRLAALIARQGWRLALTHPRRLARRVRLLAAPRIDRIALAPDDLRPGDPRLAGDIADGIFELGGVAVDCRGRSPFTVVAPTPDWEAALHRFRWLRHLALMDAPDGPQRARVLVAEWARYGSTSPAATTPDAIAERLLSWLYHAPLVLDGASPAFHQRFLELVNDETRLLATRYGEGPDGVPRVRQAAALCLIHLAVPGLERRAGGHLRRLDRELTRQVLSDGCHVSRNPAALIDLLLDVLPIRTVLAELGLPASRTMMGTIDRVMPMLRFFRHADGALALFNGAGLVAPDLLASVFLQDDARARPPGQALYGGYQRLEAGRTIVLVDTGPQPALPHAREAHMAPLALELSSGRHRFIVSTGVAADPRADWRRAAREAAAHSTLVMNDDSPGEILDGWAAGWLGDALVNGPHVVSVERQEHQGITAVLARHDGYVATYGLWHERTLRLSARGDRLDGRDRTFAPGGRRPRRANLFLRFHVHPSIRATLLSNGVVILMAEDGEAWEFRAEGPTPPRLEPSVFLAGSPGPKANEQIVLSAKGVAEIRWTMHRSAEPRGGRTPAGEAQGFDPFAGV